MSFHSEQFAAECGLQCAEGTRTCFGTLNGFTVFAAKAPRRNFILCTFSALPADDADYTEALSEYRLAHTGLNLLQYEQRTLTAVIALPPKDAEAAAAKQVTELTAFASGLKWRPCCMACGRTDDFSPFLLDGRGISVCRNCLPELRANMAKAEQSADEKKPHIAGTVLGLVLCAVTVFLLVWLSVSCGRGSWLAGCIGTAGSLMLLRKLAKKITPAAAAAAGILCLLGAFCGTYFASAQSLAQQCAANAQYAQEYIDSFAEYEQSVAALSPEAAAEMKAAGNDPVQALEEERKNLDAADLLLSHQTLLPCLRDFPQTVKALGLETIRKNFISKLLEAVIAVFVTGGITLPKMLAESRGRHSLRALP